ncbi:MurR/RpiR family transcriptional regulator [Clostridium sp. DL1XJH146]
MGPAVIAKIISMQQNYTMSENEISQYIIKNSEFVVSSTITTIAKETGTSEASINRFCKKIGYKGFNKFKIALAQENFYNSIQKQSTHSGEIGFIESVTMDYRKMLMNTSAMLDEPTVFKSVDFIKSAQNIHIIALFNSSLVAYELEFKFNLIGIPAKTHTDVLDINISTSNISKNDLAIIIAPTILSKDIYQALTSCHERGSKIITITSFDSPQLNDLVDLKFITSDKVTAHNSNSLSNNLMFLYVIDIIYGALLKSDKSLYKKKLDSDTIINHHQKMNNYIYEY